MSLPPLLLERLKRRKIIQEIEKEPVQQKSNIEHTRSSNVERVTTSIVVSNLEQNDEEEIIAEDYSDEGDTRQSDGNADSANDTCDFKSLNETSSHEDNSDNLNDEVIGKELSLFRTESVVGCPNKYNIYHECSQYCVDNYSSPKSSSPTLEQRKQLALILRAYPMSNEWTVVYDSGVRTFYFWNIITNLVSWFPPAMDSFISPPADQIRQSMKIMGFS